MYERNRCQNQHSEDDDYDPLDRRNFNLAQPNPIAPCLKRTFDGYHGAFLGEPLIGLHRHKGQDRGQCFSQAHRHRLLQACPAPACHCRPFFRLDEIKMPANGVSQLVPTSCGKASASKTVSLSAPTS